MCLMTAPADLATTCQTWGFAAGHVLVNRERNVHGRPQLQRSPALDRLAQLMAREAVKRNDMSAILVEHRELQATLGNIHVAQVISVGDSIHDMHQQAMQFDPEARKAILSEQHKQFGMGTARCPGSQGIVMVQLFRG